MEETTRRHAYGFDEAPSVDPDELIRLLGGKGANLVVMARDLGLPVPPGFTITTESCVAVAAGASPAGFDDEVRAQLERLGDLVGRGLGDPDDPLLVSVRSGAPVSMPGMMDTLLNVGLTTSTVRGLAATSGGESFAADCLARLQSGYRQLIGSELPDDPWRQLRSAIEAVFASWNSERARAYRRREGISDDIGTAVTIQAMVFGNRGAGSATGVCFTRDPSTGERALYGDVLFDAQGEDVVAGGKRTEPIAVLAERLPSVATELEAHADRLERHYRDLCDIEFTVERGKLWLLQVRVGKRSPRAALRIAIDMASDDGFPLSREEALSRVSHLLADVPREFMVAGTLPAPLAEGLPASPGFASGVIATSSDDAEAAAAAGQPVILVRPETSPEDVRGMAAAAGILTARGGLASHAAVVARGWGIPAVVGAEAVAISGDSVDIGSRHLEAGALITIDGGSGAVFDGALPGDWQSLPEAEELAAWAAELGIGTDAPKSAPTSAAGAGGDTLPPPGDDDLLRCLLVRGATDDARLADALLAPVERISPIVQRLVDGGGVERTDAGARLTTDGRMAAQALFAADRDRVGAEVCDAALDAFHELDGRMKAIVTAWQVRDDDGEQRLNDHADAAYDARVLERLDALDADAGAWLAAWPAASRAIAAYRARLAAAAGRVRAGDPSYVASPRVDSYHGVWFELHEDLIRLAGRTRADVPQG